jgi:DNA-binding NtrC family response regulator
MLDPNKITIAHIDDDPVVLDMTKLVLEKCNRFSVRSYSTAEDFLDQLVDENKPELLIVDYFLNSKISSAMSGSQLIKIFRNQKEEIPVIVISSQKSLTVALDLIQLEVVDYIEKTDGFVSKIVDSVNSVLEMQTNEVEKEKVSKVLKKDKKHLFLISLFFLSLLSVGYFIGKMFA